MARVPNALLFHLYRKPVGMVVGYEEVNGPRGSASLAVGCTVMSARVLGRQKVSTCRPSVCVLKPASACVGERSVLCRVCVRREG